MDDWDNSYKLGPSRRLNVRPTLPEGLYLVVPSWLMLVDDMCEFKCRLPAIPRLNLTWCAFPLPLLSEAHRFLVPWCVLSFLPLPCCANRGFRGLSCTASVVVNERTNDGAAIGSRAVYGVRRAPSDALVIRSNEAMMP